MLFLDPTIESAKIRVLYMQTLFWKKKPQKNVDPHHF